ncbi:CD3324 family protein [Gorillibacterium sp. CAU 1737]|uniref:CD3324 family protein n=1 Tax=Gorillibacterium sp. CAU 1737 TaxID=3140362 RepID=UPI0032605EA0
MDYLNAGEVLPEALLNEVRKYAAGKLLYVPQEPDKKAWGEVSGYRHALVKRNQYLRNKFEHGISIRELAAEFGLSEESIKRIVYSRKDPNRLGYAPTSASAVDYAKVGLLEEWVHTYLLFHRVNPAFSDGLRLAHRYYLGPFDMPLSLFRRTSGPEEGMKWQVHPAVFADRVAKWEGKLLSGEGTPPLLIQYAEGEFELNSDSPLFEALVRSGVRAYPVVIWVTGEEDRDTFLTDYAPSPYPVQEAG